MTRATISCAVQSFRVDVALLQLLRKLFSLDAPPHQRLDLDRVGGTGFEHVVAFGQVLVRVTLRMEPFEVIFSHLEGCLAEVDCAGSQGFSYCGMLFGELVASLIIIIIGRLNKSSVLN